MVDINALDRKRLHLILPMKTCIKQNTNKKHRMEDSLMDGVFPNTSFSSDLRDLRWKMGSAFISLWCIKQIRKKNSEGGSLLYQL